MCIRDSRLNGYKSSLKKQTPGKDKPNKKSPFPYLEREIFRGRGKKRNKFIFDCTGHRLIRKFVNLSPVTKLRSDVDIELFGCGNHKNGFSTRPVPPGQISS